jgi:hypothetical protein
MIENYGLLQADIQPAKSNKFWRAAPEKINDDCSKEADDAFDHWRGGCGLRIRGGTGSLWHDSPAVLFMMEICYHN